MYDRIIYASRAVAALGEEGLRDLLNVSRDRNGACDVTGLLVYAEQSFLQVIEGPGAAIEETYGRIVADERHHDIRLLTREGVEDRLFPDWTMGFFAPAALALERELPGYRPESAYPFVAGDLVPNREVALTLLRLWAEDAG
ncbi:MAG: BLUF domain-containing protein [Nocardioides sp.]|uniref:BLUF domain-containing protein n=1 Tax=Nocardioides sp. TaxID=35761 RepID=UPI0039E21BA8